LKKMDGYLSGLSSPSAVLSTTIFADSPIVTGCTIVLDPSDGKTFWAANEYIGTNGLSDIWRTHITSFDAR
jgi:hypothetical protein